MLTSLAYIFLLGLFFATLCQKLKLPRIIGMIVAELILFVLVGAAVDIDTPSEPEYPLSF